MCVKYVGVFVYIYDYTYTFCLLSFMYVCLQREGETAKWVGIDFHQPCPCSEPHPCFPPAASEPMCSVLQAAATRVLPLLAGGMQMLCQPQLSSLLLRVPLDVLRSLGGRWSLPRDLLLCQGDAQAQNGADVGLFSAPVLSAMGKGGSISPQAVPVIPMG